MRSDERVPGGAPRQRSATRALGTTYLTLALLLAPGCAFNVYEIDKWETELRAASTPLSDWVLRSQTKIPVGPGYSRQLGAGSRWTHVGQVREGQVFRTKDQVLTIEASNVYEAYLVMDGDDIVGFYLPAVRSFSPISKRITLNRTEV